MVDTTAITIVSDSELDVELERLANATGHSKPDVARDVLADWFQDQQDYRDAAEIIARNEPSSSSAEVRRRLGLDR